MTIEEFKDLFKDLDDNEFKLLEPIMEQTYKLRKEIDYLESLPQIKVHPEMPEIQKQTEAAKMKIKLMQQMKESTRLLLSSLRKGDLGSESSLAKMLAEFNSGF